MRNSADLEASISLRITRKLSVSVFAFREQFAYQHSWANTLSSRFRYRTFVLVSFSEHCEKTHGLHGLERRTAARMYPELSVLQRSRVNLEKFLERNSKNSKLAFSVLQRLFIQWHLIFISDLSTARTSFFGWLLHSLRWWGLFVSINAISTSRLALKTLRMGAKTSNSEIQRFIGIYWIHKEQLDSLIGNFESLTLKLLEISSKKMFY